MSTCYFFLNPSSSNSTVLFYQFKKGNAKGQKKWSTQLRETHFNTIVASVRLTGLTLGIEKLQHKIDSD